MPGVETVTRTAHSTLTLPSVWQVDVKGDTDFQVYVQRILFVGGGKDASFDITIDARNVPIGQVRSATLYLTETGFKKSRVLHIPITFIRTQPVIPMTKTCDPASISRGGTTTCTISFTNNTFGVANVQFTDILPLQLKLIPGSVTGAKAFLNSVSFKGTLTGAQPPDVSVVTGVTPAGGYLPLSLFGITPISGVGDETIANFNVPAFMFGGETYTSIGVVSDGYVVVGGGTQADVQFINQKLPDPTPPNNVLAPFWTDLDGSKGVGAVRVATLTDGTNTWIVVDYNLIQTYSGDAGNTFEIWIQIGATQGISYAYDTISKLGEGGLLTVGAENRFGNRGSNTYYNGTGTAPSASTQLVVNSVPGAPGETKTITYKAMGLFPGKWVNYANLTSDLYQGVNIAPFAGEVKK